MGTCNDQLWSHRNGWRWRILDNYVIMPIAINGSGTITGLSVGGLPDGIVDTDTIANNAVTDAKSTIVGGKILQYVVGTVDTTGRETSSESWVTESNGINVQITPTATSSKILLLSYISIGTNDGNDAGFATIYRDIGGTNTNLGDATAGMVSGRSVDGITGLYYQVGGHWIDSPNTTSQCTYQMYFKVKDIDSDGHNAHINKPCHGSGNIGGYIHALELAG